jgi:hypothetical protein
MWEKEGFRQTVYFLLYVKFSKTRKTRHGGGKGICSKVDGRRDASLLSSYFISLRPLPGQQVERRGESS